MSDERLRELERRWKESGSVEDEAAYLKERVRVGDLSQERLELAALWGHQGAQLALRNKDLAFEHWLSGLAKLPHPAQRRAALACAAHVWDRHDVDPRVQTLLDAYREYITAPDDHSRVRIDQHNIALNGVEVRNEEELEAFEAVTWVLEEPVHSVRSAMRVLDAREVHQVALRALALEAEALCCEALSSPGNR